jgi:F-type H+-transporting ATPase subunit delta
MAETKTVARPYAEAVFQLAQQTDELSRWSERLALLAGVAVDDDIAQLAKDPRVPRERLAGLLLTICGDRLGPNGENLVRVLAENRRVPLLPQIHALFETLSAEAEGRVEATVISAFALDTTQKQNIEQTLKRKFGREVNLTAEVDKDLIGGIVIRAGDLVIDGSARGRLRALASKLNH